MRLSNLERFGGRPYREFLHEGRAIFRDIEIESGFEAYMLWHWQHFGELQDSSAIIPDWTSFTRRGGRLETSGR
jgi:hypothetical protein